MTEAISDIIFLKQTIRAPSCLVSPALLAGRNLQLLVVANNVGALYQRQQENVGLCNKTEKGSGNSLNEISKLRGKILI